MKQLETADRLVVKDSHLAKTVKEAAPPDDLAAVLSLIHTYPTGWKSVMSGAIGDYDIYFYRGNQLLGDVGLTASTIFPGQDSVHVGAAFRQVPKDDVTRLATRLGLTWPTR